MSFKIKSLDHFLPSFLSKNGNFKTRDFSPLIKRVLAGVRTLALCSRTCVCLRLKICEMYAKYTDCTCPVDVSGDRFDLGDC